MEEELEGGDEKKEVQIQPCLYDDVMATSQVIRADFEGLQPFSVAAGSRLTR